MFPGYPSLFNQGARIYGSGGAACGCCGIFSTAQLGLNFFPNSTTKTARLGQCSASKWPSHCKFPCHQSPVGMWLTCDKINCIIEEGGKTMQDAKTEFDKGIDAILTATAIGSEMMGTYSSNNPVRIHTFHEPVVCLASPASFPIRVLC